jgi:hypothetical protein
MRQTTAIFNLIFMVGFSLRMLFPNEIVWSKNTFQETPVVFIQWPLPGQALLGNIEISGNTAVDGYYSTDLFFGYANDPTDTWFLIAQSESPVQNGVLVNWDTTVISDGNYNIKLSVTLQDGAQISSTIQGVRVRNYSPIEPDTPTPVTPTLTPVPGETPIPTSTITPILPTSTPLPTNPVILTSTDFIAVFGRGALFALVLFIFLGVYLGIRSMMRNRP